MMAINLETPMQRLRRAAREFEQALNEVGNLNDVSVNAIDVTCVGDWEHRFTYWVCIQQTTTNRVYP